MPRLGKMHIQLSHGCNLFFVHFMLVSLQMYLHNTLLTTIASYWHRNGTPRQPLLVPLARACLVFNTTRVPPASLEGLAEYSHCWIIYVFHLNTDLEKLWKHPSKSGFKAKVCGSSVVCAAWYSCLIFCFLKVLRISGWIGEGPKTERWKNGSVWHTIPTSSVPNWTYSCKGNTRWPSVMFLTYPHKWQCFVPPSSWLISLWFNAYYSI